MLADNASGSSSLIVCEILQGLSQRRQDAATRPPRPAAFRASLEAGGVELAAAAARNYRRLRTRGRTVRKTIDCLICLVHEHTLLHHDRDFDAFEEVLDLQVLHP